MEDAAECGYHLQGKNVLPAVVADFENRALPGFDCVLRGRPPVLGSLCHHLLRFLDAAFGFFDAEGSHEWRLSMGLQWFARLSIDANHDTIGVTGKVDSNFNLDLSKLLFNLLLLLGFRSRNVRFEFSRYARDLIKEAEFSFVETLVLWRETFDHLGHYFIKGGFDTIRLALR